VVRLLKLCDLQPEQLQIYNVAFRNEFRLLNSVERKGISHKLLDGHGRARRKAARRRKSECNVNLDILNSSRSSASKRLQKLHPRTTWRMDFRQLTAYEYFGCVSMHGITVDRKGENWIR